MTGKKKSLSSHTDLPEIYDWRKKSGSQSYDRQHFI